MKKLLIVAILCLSVPAYAANLISSTSSPQFWAYYFQMGPKALKNTATIFEPDCHFTHKRPCFSTEKEARADAQKKADQMDGTKR